MKRRLLLLTALVLIGTLIVTLEVSAQGERVDVLPYLDGAQFEASPNQEVHIYWFWVATTPGLVNVFRNASHHSYTLTGPDGTVTISEPEADQYWSPTVQAPAELAGWDCPRPLVAASFFDYNLGHLAPGTYTLVETETFDHPVNDGLHVCTYNGDPLAEPPSLYPAGTTVSTVTIVVE